MRNDWDTSQPAELVPGREYYLSGVTRLENTNLDVKNWKDPPGAKNTTETRKFKPNGTPGQFWVEGYNYTPAKLEDD